MALVLFNLVGLAAGDKRISFLTILLLEESKNIYASK